MHVLNASAMHKTSPKSIYAETTDVTQTDRWLFSLYSRLAKVPVLPCRLGPVSYNRTFGALAYGLIPHNHTFGALISTYAYDLLLKILIYKKDPSRAPTPNLRPSILIEFSP